MKIGVAKNAIFVVVSVLR